MTESSACDWCGKSEGARGFVYGHSENVSSPHTGRQVRVDVNYRLDGSLGRRHQAYLHSSCAIEVVEALAAQRIEGLKTAFNDAFNRAREAISP